MCKNISKLNMDLYAYLKYIETVIKNVDPSDEIVETLT